MGATPPAGAVVTQIAAETLWLLPQRAIYLPERRTLLIADVHFGKAAAFRAAGIPLPGGTTRETLHRLSAALAATGAAHVIVLGDLLHARSGVTPAMIDRVAAWRAGYPHLSWSLVRGNHDRHAGHAPADWHIEVLKEGHALGPFRLRHDPAAVDGGYVLAGHVHPSIRLTGTARENIRLPCFRFDRAVGVLPAFGSFTGGHDIEPQAHDRVWVIAEDRVLAVERPPPAL